MNYPNKTYLVDSFGSITKRDNFKMFSLKSRPLLFTFHRGQSKADHIRTKNNIIALRLDILLLKRAGTEAGAQHLSAAGKQAASL